MSGFKFSHVLFLISILGLGLLVGFAIGNKNKTKSTDSYHNVSLYTAEGDTIFDIESDSESIKIWIEEDGELDVWTYSDEGWWIRQEK